MHTWDMTVTFTVIFHCNVQNIRVLICKSWSTQARASSTRCFNKLRDRAKCLFATSYGLQTVVLYKLDWSEL